MKLSRLTIFVFCSLLFLLLAFDVWTLAARGYETTVSWTLYEMGKGWPIIPFAFGVVVGHLWWANKAGMK